MEEQIGRYEVRRELGRGGMATVYLALDPNIRRQVAIKVLPRQFTHDPKYLARFQQEAETIAALEHPAIVPIYDFGEFNDAPFLVMRYMSGGTLRERLKGEPLPLEEIAEILHRVAPALDYAHQGGVIHRDLKPANILFDHQGNAYLADFGIARLAEASQTVTMIGTPAYMSPEQVESQLKLDGRSDIYALGVMLYEMLSGEPPYTAETPTGQMLMHITQPVPDVLQLRPDLPPETQGVVKKAMAKDRQERYQTAAELAAAVNTLLTFEATAGEDTAPAAAAENAAEAEPDSEVAEPAAAVAAAGGSAASPPLDSGGKSGGLPGWIWWVGALALLLITAFSLRAILSDGGNDEEVSAAAVTATFEAAVVVALTENAPTATPMEEGVGEEQGRENQADAVDKAEETPAAALQPAETPLPTEEPSPTAEPTEAPTQEPSPTPLPDPGFPPRTAQLGDTWERPADGMTMVYVPEGSFPMGSEEGYDDEKPVHDVSLDGYWIDRTEITNDQFAQFVEATGYETTAEKEGRGFTYSDGDFQEITGADWQHPQGPDSDINGLTDHPVVQVSWYDAEAYCAWAETRLPTEAEWAYAARGPEGYRYPWGEQVPNCNLAQFGSCAGQTIPTGSLPRGASWVGALDMSGNVIEWTNDWYDENYYANSPGLSPQGPDNGEFKVARGGSWLNDELSVRSAIRGIVNPVDRRDYVGFRCVVSPGS